MIIIISLIFILFCITWVLIWSLFFKLKKNDTVLLDKGARAYENGNYKKAKDLFLKLVKLTNSPSAKIQLGLTYLGLGDYEEAKKHFEEVVKASPKNVEALVKLGEVNKLLKDYDKALEAYEKAQEQEPENVKLKVQISEIFYAKKDFNKAMEILEKAKEIAPESTEVKFLIVRCKSNLCDYNSDEECEKMLQEYAELSNLPDLPPGFHVSYAKAFAVNGKIEDAWEHCQKSLQTEADDIDTYQLLGLISLLKQDYESAKNNLTIALNFEQGNKETHNIFSYVLCRNVTACPLPKCRERYFKLVNKHFGE